MIKAPLFTDTLKQAAQYVYDTRLSKVYTNTSCYWDWGYPDETTGPIWRPNHGLAHSSRGALYAPTVIQYFQEFAQDKEHYSFSEADIEKIQIALMFRVSGRENESGYSDDPVAYAEYQKGHARYFKEYCQNYPDIFTDEEVEKFAKVLQSYARPDSLDPLSLIFKTCHNLDLLRVRDSAGMARELKEPVRVLGQEKVTELMHYADSCIRATGNRICLKNNIVGKPGCDYNPVLFQAASTDVSLCFNMIASIAPPRATMTVDSIRPLPATPIDIEAPTNILDPLPPTPEAIDKNEVQNISTNPAQKSNSLITQLLLNHLDPTTLKALTLEDYQNLSSTLLAVVPPIEIYKEINKLLRDKTIPTSEKQKIHHNACTLLKYLLSHESSSEQFKPLTNWISATKQQSHYERDSLVIEYNKLQDLIETEAGLNHGLAKEFEIKRQLQKLSKIPGQTILQADYEKRPKKEVKVSMGAADFNHSVTEYAEALKIKCQYLLGQVKDSDLVSPYIFELQTTKALLDHSRHFVDSVIQDILKAKNIIEQTKLFDFYLAVMEKSIQNGDYNSAYCVLHALNSPAIKRLDYIENKLNSRQISLQGKMNQLFNPLTPAEYQNIYANNKCSVPVFSLMLSEIERIGASGKLTITSPSGEQRPNLAHSHLLGKALNQARQYKIRAQAVTYSPVVANISGIDTLKLVPNNKKMEWSENTYPQYATILPPSSSYKNTSNMESNFTALLNILNTDMEFPTILRINQDGKDFVSGQKETYNQLIQTLISLTQSLAKMTSLPPDMETKYWQGLAVWLKAFEKHTTNNKYNAEPYLSMLQNIVYSEVDVSQLEQIKSSLSILKKWNAGNPSVYSISSPMLEMGPLPKNQYTVQLESLVRGLLYGYAFEVYEDKTTHNITIVMGGQEYHLAKIFENANLNHLNFSDEEKALYAKALNDNVGYLNFSPGDSSDPENTHLTIATSNDISQLDAQFLATDPTLNQISQGERLALNIYTTGFYGTANQLLRTGKVDLPKDNARYNFLWETLCHSAMAVSGLNGRTNTVPATSFRGELNLPQKIVDQRVKAADKKQAIIECGFVSSSKDKPSSSFIGFENSHKSSGNVDVAIVFKDLVGRDIQALSAYPSEREFLMPPTQIQWIKQEKLSGGYYLVGKPLRTLQGLRAEHLDYIVESKVEATISESFLNALAEAEDYQNFLDAFHNAPNLLITLNKDIIDVAILKQEVFRILNDLDELAYILNEPLKAVPELEKLGIRAEFGMLESFLNQVQLAHEWHLKNKISSTSTLSEMISTIRNHPQSLTDSPDQMDIIIQEMESMMRDPNIVEAIFHAQNIPVFIGKKEIGDNKYLKGQFVLLATVKHISNVIESQQTLEELSECLNNFNDIFKMPVHVDNKDNIIMLKNLKHFIENPDMVSSIANHGDSELIFGNSFIPTQFGIRDKLITLIRIQHQAKIEQSFQNALSEVSSLDDIVALFQHHTNENSASPYPSEQMHKTLAEIETIVNDSNLIEAIFHADRIPFFVEQTHIRTHSFLKEHLVQLAKDQYVTNTINSAETIEELMGYLDDFEQIFKHPLHSNNKDQREMLDTMKKYINEPNIQQNIAESQNPDLVFKNTIIPTQYGIRDKFSSLVRRDYQIKLQQNFQDKIKQTKDVKELIILLKNNTDVKLPLTGAQIDLMLSNMKQFAENPGLAKNINHSGDTPLLFNKSYILKEFGIREQFIRLVQLAQQQVIAKNLESKESPPQTHAIDEGQIIKLLDIRPTDISHYITKQQTSKKKELLKSLQIMHKSTNGHGGKSQESFNKICQAFNQIKQDNTMGVEVKAEVAYAFVCHVESQNMKNGTPNSKKVSSFCQNLKQKLDDCSSQDLKQQVSGNFEDVLKAYALISSPLEMKASNSNKM
tara:strand:+ start:2172 stop:7853 length:5682 start_codon:yes stop_codon:yes gene_type:complete